MNKQKVYSQKLKRWYDPEAVFVSLFGKEKYSFWLDSSKTDENLARFSYMGGVKERICYSLGKGILKKIKDNKTQKLQQSIFDYLDTELKRTVLNSDLPFDFTGGFAGYLGYELKAECGSKQDYKSQFPDADFFFIDKFLAFDHKEQKVYLVCISDKKERAERWFEKIKKNIVIPTDPPTDKLYSARNDKNIEFNFSRNRSQYLRDIKKCQEYLQNGESYQICLTNRITTRVKTDWLNLYLALRRINPAPYSAYMRFGDFAVLSSSPEMFLKIDGKRQITSKPIKGTVRRGENREEDKKLAQSLGKSEKDYAENIMIVDLIRNDLGKVCEIGSISVPKLLEVETYATVHQLVSTVTGKLNKDVSNIDAVKAAFPGGSMTGAPKIRAMEIISDLEKSARGIYSGALGFLSLNGTMELSIVIRTIIAQKQKLSFGSGGAILLQSDAQSEYNEMLLKTKALIRAISYVVSSM